MQTASSRIELGSLFHFLTTGTSCGNIHFEITPSRRYLLRISLQIFFRYFFMASVNCYIIQLAQSFSEIHYVIYILNSFFMSNVRAVSFCLTCWILWLMESTLLLFSSYITEIGLLDVCSSNTNNCYIFYYVELNVKHFSRLYKHSSKLFLYVCEFCLVSDTLEPKNSIAALYVTQM